MGQHICARIYHNDFHGALDTLGCGWEPLDESTQAGSHCTRCVLALGPQVYRLLVHRTACYQVVLVRDPTAGNAAVAYVI